jgi:hypothetical protein
MAEYTLRSSLNPYKVVKCNISFRQLLNKGEEGKVIWLVEIRTVEPHKDGGDISPVYINYTSEKNLDKEIKKATEKIAEQINWEPLIDDLRPPFVSYSNPINNETVDIYSDVIVDIKDVLPAAGIDINSIKVIVNDIDVTDDIEVIGDPYYYRIKWSPSIRVLDKE